MATGPADADLPSYLWSSSALLAAQLDPDGVVLAANPALTRRAGQDLVGTPFADLVSAPQRAALAARLAAAGAAWDTVTLAFADGGGSAEDRHVRFARTGDVVLVVAEPAWQERDRLVEQVLELNDDLIRTQRDLGRRQRQLEEARGEAQAAVERIRQLEAITLAGLTRPDLDGALGALLGIAREVIACDRADVLLSDDDDGHLRLRATAGALVAADSAARDPLGGDAGAAIVATGRPMVIHDLGAEAVVSPRLGVRGGSLAGVPLTLEGRAIGALLVSSVQAGRFGDAEVRLLGLVGERAALAIGHAQLRVRERRIAETLQRSLLPQRLPELAAVPMTARYLPRAYTAHVGGDFYDAVVRDDGRIALAIGDVAGKGLRAASAMGELRSAWRAYALDGAPPARILRGLDGLLVAEREMATALALLLDPATGHLTFANAGHPPPVLLDQRGKGALVDGALSAPLGVGMEDRPQHDLSIEPGTRLLLYTDGLVERRRSGLDEGFEHLVRAAAGPGDLDALCDRVLARLGGHDLAAGWQDDVALLAVELAARPV